MVKIPWDSNWHKKLTRVKQIELQSIDRMRSWTYPSLFDSVLLIGRLHVQFNNRKKYSFWMIEIHLSSRRDHLIWFLCWIFTFINYALSWTSYDFNFRPPKNETVTKKKNRIDPIIISLQLLTSLWASFIFYTIEIGVNIISYSSVRFNCICYPL